MSLYPMFMKCYYHLHPSTKSDNGFVDQKVDDDNSLNLIQMITRRIELTK